MQKDIKAESRSLRQVFADGFDTNLSVPAYQRAYDWDSEQFIDLWNDLAGHQEARAKDPSRNHVYAMGYIQTVVNEENGYRHSSIIDGQQRLTTFYLFTLATIWVCQRSASSSKTYPLGQDNQNVLGYMKSLIVRYDGDTTVRSLTPRDSYEEFFHALEYGTFAKDNNYIGDILVHSAIANKTFDQVLKRIADRRVNNPDAPSLANTSDNYRLYQRLREIVQGIHFLLDYSHDEWDLIIKKGLGAVAGKPDKQIRELVNMMFNSIRLNVEEKINWDIAEAQMVFERTNTRGKDLTLGDIINNDLCSGFNLAVPLKNGAGRPITQEQVRSRWEAIQSHTRDKSVEGFLAAWLMCAHGVAPSVRIQVSKLLSDFRTYGSTYPNIGALFTDLEKFAASYAQAVEDSGRMMAPRSGIQILAAANYAFDRNSYPENGPLRSAMRLAVEGLVFRWTLCSPKLPQALKDEFASHAMKIAQAGSLKELEAQAASTIAALTEYDAFEVGDELTTEKLLTYRFAPHKAKLPLWRISEVSSSSDYSIKFNDLHLEHIAPREGSDSWVVKVAGTTPDGSPDVDRYKDYYQNLIGNMTLLNGKTNSSLKNAEWADKKREYLNEVDDNGNTITRLPMTLDVAARKEWDQAAIEARTNEIAEKLITSVYSPSRIRGLAGAS